MTRRVFIPEVGWEDEVIYTEKDMIEAFTEGFNARYKMKGGVEAREIFLEKIRNNDKTLLSLQNDSLL